MNGFVQIDCNEHDHWFLTQFYQTKNAIEYAVVSFDDQKELNNFLTF